MARSEFKKIAGIYQIKLDDGRIYVGSAVDIVSRFCVHKHNLRKNKHHSIKLQRAWNKYGEQKFTFTVLEIVADILDLLEREQHYIDKLCACKFGFNISPVAGNTFGKKHSKEAREKMSKAATKREYSEEARKKMSESQRRANRKGEKRSAETREKIRLKATGRKASDETRKKLSAIRTGKKMSDRAKGILAECRRIREEQGITTETRAKMSDAAKRRVERSLRGDNGRFVAKVQT